MLIIYDYDDDFDDFDDFDDYDDYYDEVLHWVVRG